MYLHSDYPVECACGQIKSDCAINGKPKARSHDDDTGSGRSHSKVHAHLFDEDSNSSWASTSSGRRRKIHKTTPLSPKMITSVRRPMK